MSFVSEITCTESAELSYPLDFHWKSAEWTDSCFAEGAMIFRLSYQGPLLATSRQHSRVEHKHDIRRELHRQLAELWKVQQPLRNISESIIDYANAATGEHWRKTRLDKLAERYERCGFRFVPLVNNTFGLVCALDILFLRRDEPGAVIMQGGDIDNRIKTLFDALRMPTDGGELPNNLQPSADENPFFCLLESDTLINEIHVSTDRLLVPAPSEAEKNHVMLIIQVTTRIAMPDRAYIEFSF